MTAALRPTVFLDRDGVVNHDTGYAHRVEDLVLTRTAPQAIARLNRASCLVIVVTNQSGVARGLFDMAAVDRFHAAIQARLEHFSAWIDAFYVAPHHPAGTVAPFNVEHDDRKPGPGMILRAMAEWPVDPARSVLIGDRDRDIEAARRAGIAGIRVPTDLPDLDDVVGAWLDAAS